MVTLSKYGAKYNRLVLNLEGLSSEVKPTVYFYEYDDDGREISRMAIQNGSIFTEVDTGKTFMYDAENQLWYEFSSGGGGGGGFTPTDSQLDAMNSGITSERVDELAGIEDSGDDYIEINGIRLYVASTAPTGDIPDGSVGVGW